MFYILNDCSTIGDTCIYFRSELDVRYNWHSLFVISNLCILTCMTGKLQVIYAPSAFQTSAVLSKIILVYHRVVWAILLASYCPINALVLLWYNVVCVYCKPVRTSLLGAQLCMTRKLTYLKTVYYTPNDGFTATTYCFIRANLTSYTTCYSVFSINCAI